MNPRGRGTSGGPAHVVTGVATRAERLPAFRERPLTRWAKVREAALVRAAQRGSEDAVAELFARHWG